MVPMHEHPSTAFLLASLLPPITRSTAIAEAVRAGFVGVRYAALHGLAP